MKLFIAPHNDDECLFGAFTIMREKPIVLVVTESYRQAERGGLPTVRRNESIAAMEILGAPVMFLGIPDARLDEEGLVERLSVMESSGSFDKVFAPAYYINGNPDHNIVSKAAERVFGERVVYYSTYRLDDLEPKGDIEIVPTDEEARIKDRALDCYHSQLALNPAHFEAVRGKNEYYVA